MRRSDFRFDLPEELIAQQPLAERSASRLLLLTPQGPQDATIRDLPAQLRPKDLVVFNDTRVIPARLQARRADTGGRVEILLERVVSSSEAWAFLRMSHPPRGRASLDCGDRRIDVIRREEELYLLRLPAGSWDTLLEAHGETPLPPYIRRKPDDADRERYQTVFAREAGAVAAPTAGLHFDEPLLAALRKRCRGFAYVTLHVGAGTFAPVRGEDLDAHRMHAERLSVTPETVAAIQAARAAGGRIVAVGTTVVRALETAAADGELAPFDGESRLFIRPGYDFRVVDALLTNFHLPESTLLMLVCAFGGTDAVLAAYRHAVAQRYRFFSYGDAMWLSRA